MSEKQAAGRILSAGPGPGISFPRTARVEKHEEGDVICWDWVKRTVSISVRVVGASGEPLQGVAVSDGEEVVLSDEKGNARLRPTLSNDGLRFVHVSVPAGRRPAGPWFWLVPPDEETERYGIEFQLEPDPDTEADKFRFLTTGDSQGLGDVWRDQLAEDFAEIASIEGRPQFHAIVGDLTMTGWKDQWDDYAAARNNMTLRHYDLFGGHGGNYRRRLGGEGERGDVGHFNLYCGPTYYSWGCGRFHCVAVNAVAGHFESPAAFERQKRWFPRDLMLAGADRPALLFSHYPTQSLEDVFGWRMGRVRVCAYGHWHCNGVLRAADGTWLVRTAALRGQDWGRLSAAVRVCDVDGETIRDELRPLGENRRLNLPWPREEVASGESPVVILAYNTTAPVTAVQCDVRGADAEVRVDLKPSSHWTWRGDCNFGALGAGRYTIEAKATDCRGESWQMKRSLIVGDGPAPRPMLGEDWPSLFGNEAAAGDEVAYRYTPDSPQPPFHLAWCVQSGGRNSFLASPVLEAGRIYLGIQDDRIGWPEGGVACYDALAGEQVWRTRMPSVHHTVAVRGDKVYAVNCQAEVCCLSAGDGTAIWRTSFREGTHTARAPVVFFDDRILASGYVHRTLLLDAETGAPDVEYDIEVWQATAVTGFDGKIFAGFRYKPQACDAATGERIWTADEPGIRYYAPPLRFEDAVLYFAGSMFALDPLTGRTLWSCEAVSQGRGVTVPAIKDGVAYCTGTLKCVAIDLHRHEPVWAHEWHPPEDLVRQSRRNDPYRCLSSPALTPDLVIFADDTGIVRALNRTDGTERWSWRIGVPIKSSPIVSGNMLFIQDCDGNLYALAGSGA